MDRSNLTRLISAAALAAMTLVSLPAMAGPFSSMFVFGDSLSDNGNNKAAGLFDPAQVVSGNTYIPSNTYAAGTYSNGPVWANYFASMIGVPLTASALGGGDYAYGGATTGTPGAGPMGFPFSLRTQTEMYLAKTGGVAQADALYVIAGGGNNARAALAAIGGGADIGATVTAAAAAFANDIGVMVDALQAAGAKHILVWDTPNLGLAPAVVAGGGAALGSFLAGSMNGALALRLAGEAGVTTFDIYGLGASLSSSFANVSDACGAVVGANCSQYAYWDGIHPTTAAHMAIANAVYVVAVPEPETYALLALGLIAVALRSRRLGGQRATSVS